MKLFSIILLLPFFNLVLGAPLFTPDINTFLANPGINAFLAQVVLLFPISGIISEVSDLLMAAESALAIILGVQTTQDGLQGSCGPVTVIFARGTVEPGDVGVLAGPPFFDALKARIGSGNVVVQGVPYPASIEGFLVGGDAEGSQTMANLVTQAYLKCPSTKVVMAGYSQGGQLVHKAAALLPASTMAAVSSIIIFGDPDDGISIANAASSKTLIICHQDDDICLHGDLILPAHLTYATDAAQAASFAASQAGY